MGDLPSSPSWRSAVTHQIDLAPAGSPQPGNLDLLDVLRQSLDDATQSTESILTAVADAARVLSRADGTALALRQNGTVVCRARSGSLAPGLGSQLDAGSGISGECLRTGTILISADALRDDRVDPDVCRDLGIRSIAVVPLRGRFGTAGILESFSTHPGTFESEQIDCLRALAEIAERAHDRDREPSAPPPVPLSAIRAALFSATTAEGSRIAALFRKDFLKKHYRIIAAFAAALILIAIVVQTSWRQTQAEIAASDRPARIAPSPATRLGDNSAPVLSPVATASPIATVRSNEPRTGRLLQKAAEVAPAADSAAASDISDPALGGNATSPSARPTSKQVVDNRSNDEPAPTVDLASAAISAPALTIVPTSAPMPEFGGAVSHGVKEAALIHRVDPTYPAPARIQRLGGPVTLNAVISPNGTVRSTKVISGAEILADAAVAAVRQWRFSPAMLDGQPVEVQMRITIDFKLP